jgi:hypothetical protein
MKKNLSYVAQLFAPETNTIVTTDLTPVISVDHNNRLVTGIQSLQTILGITEMTPMTAGSQVKQYKYNKKNTPNQVGEGEVVPLTEYERKLVKTFNLVLKKYRKQTTAEAIQSYGRNKAVNDTDALLEKEVQKEVKATLIEAIKAGTGTASASKLNDMKSLQKVLASIWGNLTTYYADMNVTPVYFVNPLDVADVLATGTITTQTAFGFTYIQNFLGLGTVILDPSMTAGSAWGTVKENLNGVYVPASGDVAQTFGLTYDATGLVGTKHYLADNSVCVDTLMMTGTTFYAEDASGIFKGTIVTTA